MTRAAAGVRHGRLPTAPPESTRAVERALRALELNRVGIWEVDRDARTTFVNEAAAAMVGYARAELRGRRLTDLMDGASAVVKRPQREGGPRGERDVRHARVRHRDGRDVWLVVASAPLLDGDGGYLGAVLTLLDVTDHKELGPPTGSWALELDSGKFEWSEETYRIFGVARPTFEPSYASAMELVHPNDRPLLQRSIAAMLVDRKPFSVYFRVVGGDGQRRVLHARGEVAIGAPKALLAGVVRDVTAVAERRLVSSRERDVLDLLAKGMTAAEIAGRLQISADTVRTHVQNAIAKLDAHNRVHAVALAVAAGEIDV